MKPSEPYACDHCGEFVRAKRVALGHTLCLACGEKAARRARPFATTIPRFVSSPHKPSGKTLEDKP